jgi:hypothetical protein
LALQLGLGLHELGLAVRQRRLSLLQLCLVLRRVDAEQHLALFHRIAVPVAYGDQCTGYACQEIGRVHRGGRASGLEIRCKRVLHRGGDADAWRLGCDEFVLLPAGTENRQREQRCTTAFRQNQ